MESEKNFKKPDRGSGKYPDHIMLSFFDDPRYNMAVSWRADTSAGDGYVIYKDENGEEKRCDAFCRVIESDIDISRFYTAHLKNLKSGEKYTYSCGDSENRSGEFSFSTQEENCDKFKFIVISDQQVGMPWEKPDYSPVTNMLKFAFERDPDIRFILAAGDNCDDGQNELQWNGMFEGFKEFCDRVPYMMTTGNHDNRGFKEYLPYPPQGKFYLDHADFFDAQFEYAYPKNGPEGFETENYTFDFGNIHFGVLGINAPETVGKWGEKAVNDTKKTWKIGSYHFPIYPAIPMGQNDDGYPWLRSTIESFDIVFEGHEHSFARTFPIKDDAMFDKPSQGTIHYQCGTGAGGNRVNERKLWHTAFFAQRGLPVYALVQVDGEKITVETIQSDGIIADRVVIDKKSDSIEPPSLPPIFDRTVMMYKGSVPYISAGGSQCEKKGDIWYAPLAVLFQYIGAGVLKTSGKLKIDFLGKTAEFTLGSKIAVTSEGETELEGETYILREQLMIPVNAVNIFNIRCKYIEHNNILDFETEIEESPLTPQP